MNEVIYLEPDDEITAVIERVREAPSRGVVLVLPRGASLSQSMINLKLLKKSAKSRDKVVLFVTHDKITENLATQIGLHVFSDVKKAKAHQIEPSQSEDKGNRKHDEADDDGGIKINRYAKYNFAAEDAIAAKSESSAVAIDHEEEAVPQDNSENTAANQDMVDTEEVMSNDDEATEPEEAHYDNEEAESEDKVSIRPARKIMIEDSADTKDVKKVKSINTGGSRKIFFTITGVLLLSLVILFFVFAPRSEVRIALATEESQKEAQLTISRVATTPDFSKGVVPGQLLTVEKELTKTIPATGTKDVGTKSAGKITVSNSWDLNTITLPVGSKFVSNNKTFLSTAAVTVPGMTVGLPTVEQGKVINHTTPGSIDVSVEADTPGDGYNIAPSNFVITSLPTEKQGSIVGHSAAAMSGGTTKQVKVVTDDDLKNAKSTVTDELSKNFQDDLKQQADKNSLTMLTKCNSYAEIDSNSTKNSGDQADTFDFTVRGKYFSLGYQQDAFSSVLKNIAEQSLDSGQMLVSFDTSTVKLEEKSCDLDAGVSQLSGKIAFQIGPKYSETDLAKLVANKSLVSGKKALASLEGVTQVTISNWPSFYQRTPILAKKIKIIFDYKK